MIKYISVINKYIILHEIEIDECLIYNKNWSFINAFKYIYVWENICMQNICITWKNKHICKFDDYPLYVYIDRLYYENIQIKLDMYLRN